MTSLSEELDEQRRWRPLPPLAHSPVFEELLRREFLPPAQLQLHADQSLASVVRFAVAQVPHYRAMFARLGLEPRDIQAVGDLPRLPMLERRTLVEQAAALRARRLPPGEKAVSVHSSSGSTGRPTRVVMTQESNFWFTLLWQRRARWWRLDPMLPFAELRSPELLPPHADGRAATPDDIVRLPAWRYLGRAFHTGPYLAFSLRQPVQRQIELLREHQAAHVCTYPGVLEEMAFACAEDSPLPQLRSLIAIASQLTEPMRRRIERTFHVPLHDGYGLNEIGQVAARCQAGNFHVHVEHCIVEIVDPAGQPCRPGQVGRILVTGLRNLAMPLLRYDSDDTAQWGDGPCPCGRTLPWFTGLTGRLRRFAVLPPDTRKWFFRLTAALEQAPADMLRQLRRYQVHQWRRGGWELRTVWTQAMPAEFRQLMMDAWTSGIANVPPLDVVQVDDIPLGPGGKRQDFTSDFFADADKPAESLRSTGDNPA